MRSLRENVQFADLAFFPHGIGKRLRVGNRNHLIGRGVPDKSRRSIFCDRFVQIHFGFGTHGGIGGDDFLQQR